MIVADSLRIICGIAVALHVAYAQTHDCGDASVFREAGYMCNDAYTCNLASQIPVSSPDDCCTACRNQIGCAAFTYESTGSLCYLWNEDGRLQVVYQEPTQITFILREPVTQLPPPSTSGVGGCGTCDTLGVQCGAVVDNCGQTIDCGGCSDGSACDLSSNLCSCGTCATWNWTCGLALDGCDNLMDCGTCDDGSMCDSYTHRCDCGTTCMDGSTCGYGYDACMNYIPCGSCGDGEQCASNTWGEHTCIDCGTCESLGLMCDGIDLCGNAIQCPFLCPSANDSCCAGSCFTEETTTCRFVERSGTSVGCYTCESVWAECGTVDIGTWAEWQGGSCSQQTLDCGSCQHGYSCDPYMFQCVSCGTCESLGIACGNATDNCGNKIQCGGCDADSICTNNKCYSPGCTGVAGHYSAEEYAVVPGSYFGMDQLRTFTVAAWISIQRVDQLERSMLAFPTGTNIMATRITVQAINTPAFLNGVPTIQFAGDATFYKKLTAPIQLNTWFHVAASFDGTNQRLYIDGVLAASAVNTAPGFSTCRTPAAMMVGRELQDNSNQRAVLDAKLAEVGVWSRVLSPSDVQSIQADRATKVGRANRLMLAYPAANGTALVVQQNGVPMYTWMKANVVRGTAPAIQSRC